MDLFLDCEWADVLPSELVSLALISADGHSVFYRERNPLPAEPTPWVSSVVYPLLDRGEYAVPDAIFTRVLREFLAGTPTPCIWYDFGADRSLCQYAIDGFEVPFPEGPTVPEITWKPCNNKQAEIERWWSSNPRALARRHHALMDAQALRSAVLQS